MKGFGGPFRIEIRFDCVVLVFLKLLDGFWLDGRASFWNGHVCGPKDGVSHELGGFGTTPVPVEMAAGESERTATVGAIGCPSDVLQITASDFFAYGWIAAMSAVGTIHSAGGWHCGENGCDPFHALGETHVEIPLVSCLKGLDPGGDGVFWQVVKFSVPVWIDGPIRFKVATEPRKKLRTTFVFGDFDRIVNAHKPSSAIHLLLKTIQMSQCRVTATAIGVNHNGVGGVEDGLILRPTVSNDFAFGIGVGFLDDIGQDSRTSVMLVIAVAVARVTGDEDNAFGSGRFSRRR